MTSECVKHESVHTSTVCVPGAGALPPVGRSVTVLLTLIVPGTVQKELDFYSPRHAVRRTRGARRHFHGQPHTRCSPAHARLRHIPPPRLSTCAAALGANGSRAERADQFAAPQRHSLKHDWRWWCCSSCCRGVWPPQQARCTAATAQRSDASRIRQPESETSICGDH